jgi:hypothetical protein
MQCRAYRPPFPRPRSRGRGKTKFDHLDKTKDLALSTNSKASMKTSFPNSVPQGRLPLAQDASPGYRRKTPSSPGGTAETPLMAHKALIAHTFFPQSARSGPKPDTSPSPYPPTQANFRRKTRAPNVTCNVWGVGLASKVCHFKKILQFSMNRPAQPMKTSKTHLEPRSWVVYGLSTTCWGRHVASGERDR